MSNRDSKGYLAINKRHWDVLARRGLKEKAHYYEQIRDGEPYIELMEPKLAPYLKNIAGKRMIVLQFGDGLLMLACAKKGAIVTGVDFSKEQIKLARKSATFCGVNVDLVQADCQHLPKTIPNNQFDLATAECGIFIWIKNLHAWMKSTYRVLKNGGKLVVSDFHPLSIIAEEKNGSATFRKSYFDQHPQIYDPKFWGEENAPKAVEFLWKLGDVINAAIESGFRIDCVEEFYVECEKGKIPCLPTDFLLIATKGRVK